jgi:SulP family sulfate permease
MATFIRENSRKWFLEEFRPETIVPGLIAGLLLGVTEVIVTLSLGSFIFSGDLSAFLPYGFGMALVSSAIMMIVVALTSRVPGVMSCTQDSTAVILAVMASTLLISQTAASPEQKLSTILVAIGLTTALMGGAFLVLGFLRLGQLVRFVPYPVIGGFLAGTGWLLVKGSFGVMTDYSLTLPNLPRLFQPDQLLLWLPGVALALVLFLGLRRIRHFLTMPGILVGAVAVFYLVLAVSGTSLQRAIQLGLLLGQTSGHILWQPLVQIKMSAVNWTALVSQAGNMAIAIFLGVVSLLLNASALELAIHREVDLNRELRSAGWANLLAGLAGGMVGYHALSLSTLSYRMGARDKLPGLLAGLICAGAFLAGTRLLAFFPRPLLGGLLLFLGFDFLWDWVFSGWSRLSRTDYAVVILILIMIAATDFLVGVGVGLGVMVLLFVLDYSCLDTVHLSLSGAEIRSNVERCAFHRRTLAESLGCHTHILRLQGFLFFGTANALMDQIRARVQDTHQPKIRYLILDFDRVEGMDSSAAISFIKEKQFAEAQRFILVLTGLSEPIRARLRKEGLFMQDHVKLFSDLDHGLEWCEERLLEQDTELHTPVTLSAQLDDSGFGLEDTRQFMTYLERVQVPAGQILIQQGEPADQLYFIERGAVSVYLETEKGQRVRLQTLGLGTTVGEMGLFLGIRTASVVTDTDVIAYRLTRSALAEMKAQAPGLAIVFSEFLARLVCERLAATSKTLEAVLR